MEGVDVWVRTGTLVMMAATIVVAAGHLGGTTTAGIDNCADDIDQLKEASAKAAAGARRVSSATESIEAKLQEARRECELWGTGGPSCEKARADHRRAVSDAESAERDFRFDYAALQTRISRTQYSCDAYGTAPAIPGVAERNREACLMLRSFRNAPLGLVQKLNADCRSLGLLEEECRICLMESYRPK